MNKMGWFVLFAGMVLVAVVPTALAAKGGGGGKPGGGGGDGIADADVAVLYQDDFALGSLWKGDGLGNVERATTFRVHGASFGPAGTTRMAFSSDDLGQGVWVVDDFAGNGLRKVVDLENLRTETSWSNGSDTLLKEELIAYIDKDPDPAAGNPYQLFVTTLSGERTQLTFGWAQKANPCWNPANRSQLLLTKHGGYGDMWLLDLELDATGTLVIKDYENVVDLKAGTLLEGIGVLDASFSPDGTKIVFAALDPRDGDDYRDIWVYVIASGELTNLTESHPGFDRRACCILADGRVLFTGANGDTKNKMKLFVMDADGRNVEPYGGSKGQQQWTPVTRP